MKSIRQRVQELRTALPRNEGSYYALTIFLGDGGIPEYSCFTGWLGYTDDNPRREIREASLVHADRMLDAWLRIEEPGMVIESPDDFVLFFNYGGHAVVEEELAKLVVPEWLAPNAMVHEGEWGYASPRALPATAMQRAPSPKLRMSIIKRDAYRCRVCGRSPKNHVDIELHVHHIRPWAAGGVTEEKNLITLCHTCHNGLDPHFEFQLYEMISSPESDRAKAYQERLSRYQAAAHMASRKADV